MIGTELHENCGILRQKEEDAQTKKDTATKAMLKDERVLERQRARKRHLKGLAMIYEAETADEEEEL